MIYNCIIYVKYLLFHNYTITLAVDRRNYI